MIIHAKIIKRQKAKEEKEKDFFKKSTDNSQQTLSMVSFAVTCEH